MLILCIIANSGINIIEVTKLLKAHKYAGTSFSDAITPSTLAQSRLKLRSNNGAGGAGGGPSKGKQKAAMENVSYPDDGNERRAMMHVDFVGIKSKWR